MSQATMHTADAHPADIPASRLSIRALTAGYRPDLPIIRDIDLDVRPAEMVCIIGPNGAGKSTLLKAICGLIPVSGGNVTLDGRELAGIRPDRLARSGLSMVPQIDNIFRRLSVAQNLALAARRCPGGRGARQAAEARMLDAFPLLQEKYTARAGSLSGGQRQFLALAMALVSEPSLLLLDEPSAGLSPMATAEILGRLRGIVESGVSILIVEQNAKAALRHSDRAYILADGRNRHTGDARALLGDSVLGALYLGTTGKRTHAAKPV